jgi:diguanylate cyclase (GGDEF)-like protein
VGAGLPGYVMTNRKPLLIDDLHSEYGRYSSDGDYYDSRFCSWLGIPLMVYDEVVGVLSVQTTEQEAYTQDDLEVLTTIADQAAVALENARLYELATVDGLTGLFVRRYFDQRLVEEWERSSRYDNDMAVALFDLDNFKKLNDTYGHQTGDEVLRHAASIVRDNMRSFDIAARYGGEEFAFIFPRTDEADAQAVAERIRFDLESNPIQTPGGSIHVTASIGLAVANEADQGNPLELVARADVALYKAKELGRNQVVLASML